MHVCTCVLRSRQKGGVENETESWWTTGPQWPWNKIEHVSWGKSDSFCVLWNASKPNVLMSSIHIKITWWNITIYLSKKVFLFHYSHLFFPFRSTRNSTKLGLVMLSIYGWSQSEKHWEKTEQMTPAIN